MNLRSGREASAVIISERRRGKSTMEEAMRSLLNEMEGKISSQISGFRSEFHDFRAEMQRDFSKLQDEVKSLASNLKETVCRVADVEERINKVEERDGIVTETLSHLLQQQLQMEDRVEYLENKSRQLNIRIYRVKEGSEGSDMVGFLKSLFTDALGIPGEELTIVHAHRSYANRPVTDEESPRSIIVRFLQWDMKQRVVRAAWGKKAPITYQDPRFPGTRFRIFVDQDFTTKLQQERSLYAPIRKRLKEKEVKSYVTYPSKLKVFTKDGILMYKTAAEASQDLVRRGLIRSDGCGQQVHLSASEQRGSSAAGEGWTVHNSNTRGKNRDLRGKVETLLKVLETT